MRRPLAASFVFLTMHSYKAAVEQIADDKYTVFFIGYGNTEEVWPSALCWRTAVNIMCSFRCPSLLRQMFDRFLLLPIRWLSQQLWLV